MKVNARKRGKTWQYYFEVAPINGKRKQIVKSGFRTKKEALEAGHLAKLDYDNTGQVYKASDISVHDFIIEWFESKAKLEYKSATLRKYDSIIRNHINKDLGNLYLRSLTAMKLQEYINQKYLFENYSKSHVSHLMSCLNLAFNYAIIPCGYLKDNPMIYVKLPRKLQPDTQNKIVSTEEIKSIVDYFDSTNKLAIKLTWLLGYYTGLRRSEILALSWNDIDFKNRTLTVRYTQSVGLNSKNILNSPKTQSSKRTISICDIVIKELKLWRKNQKENRLYYGEYYINNYIDSKGFINRDNNGKFYDFIFTKENGIALVSSDIGRSIKLIKNHLNLDIKFHDLRHTHATILIQNGAPLKAVQSRLGHSKLDMTFNVYLHNTPDMEKELVNILENIK
ncbi:MAG: tyrosine-type recombinase/integrase [Clostridium sp.]